MKTDWSVEVARDADSGIWSRPSIGMMRLPNQSSMAHF
jgi:hypothetical protein